MRLVRAATAARITAGAEFEEFLAVMLTDAEHVESDPVGGLRFREKFLHPVGGWQGLASRRIGDRRSETVDADFYHRQSMRGSCDYAA